MTTQATFQVSRQELAQKVEQNVANYEREYARAARGSFAERGAYTRLGTAKNLLWRLNHGETPSTQEVVGYFGKGARFSK